ncbi:hypothetical protein Sps_03993 [Shewanella psychrophila]|uniref:Tandem-95 repeat protein n=1 Tax=Shewanella psychrophila TaxID=225848 RepID=A0A1S6HUL4_9GAMM|nr:Ig-like domain-containing protein [Shewanella psychrophila]AQS39108.1 hypothetical protein Sps_03993 [Shewanella psychrophila]
MNFTKLSLPLAIISALSLTACGSDSDDTKTSGPVKPLTPVAPTSPPPVASLTVMPINYSMQSGETLVIDVSSGVDFATQDWSLTDSSLTHGLGDISNAEAHSFVFTSAQSGVEVIDYSVTADGKTATSQIFIAINDAAVADNLQPSAQNVALTTDSASAVSVDLSTLIADADNDALELLVIKGGVGEFSFDGLNVNYVPNGYVGVDHGVYAITDGRGGYAMGDILVTVSDANPVKANQWPTAKDLLQNTDSATGIDLDLVALGLIGDTDGDALSLTRVIGAEGRVTQTSATSLHYEPNGFVGVEDFSYVISDGNEGYALGAVNVTVSDAQTPNTAPVASAIDAGVFNLTAQTSIDVSGHVSDVNGDNLSLVSVLSAQGVASIDVNNPLSIEYDANGFVGTDTFTYVVTDGKGGFAQNTVTIEITPNNVPTASLALESTLSNEVKTIDLSSYVGDVDGDTVSIVSIAAATAPASLSFDGLNVTYSANGFVGTDYIRYTVSDGMNETSNTLSIVSSSANAITAQNVVATTAPETEVVIGLASAISSSEAGASLTLSTVAGATLGAAAINADASTITYTPTAGQYGTDRFVYSVVDANDNVAQGVVTVTISEPVAPSISSLSITGDWIAGQALQSDITCSDCDSASHEYRWSVGGLTVSTEPTYVLTEADVNKSVRVDVTAYNDYGMETQGFQTVKSLRVTQIFGSLQSLSALKNDGSVVTWGNASFGGDSSAVAAELSSGVLEVFPAKLAIAALKDDGSVVTWGDAGNGGDSSTVAAQLTSGVLEVFSNDYVFAALKEDGSLVIWGHPNYGGKPDAETQAKLDSGVLEVLSTDKAIVALKKGGAVVVWGDAAFGGDSSPVAAQLTSGVVEVSSTGTSFAGLKSDGSVVAWGKSSSGGNIDAETETKLGNDVVEVFSNWYAFAALKIDEHTDERSVVAWGSASYGGVINAETETKLGSDVVEVFSTLQAFAALKKDGSVVAWGAAGNGGDSSAVAAQLTRGVIEVFSTNSAFAAIKVDEFTGDRSVVAWGNSANGGAIDAETQAKLGSDVVEVFSSSTAFAALKEDGSVVAWGDTRYGGVIDAETQAKLNSGVLEVSFTSGGFTAIKEDGSVVSWGYLGTAPNEVAPQTVILESSTP